jgi:hypothetical protein
MAPNFLILALTALIPLIVGFIWYNPKVLGTAWMKSAGLTEESMKGANMALVFGLTYLFSLFLSLAITTLVVHQTHLFSLLEGNPDVGVAGSAANQELMDLVTKYGANFRSYKHGALHGFIACLLIVLPVMGVNALFERKGFKYIAINVGFWAVCMMIMGAIICQHGVVYNQ